MGIASFGLPLGSTVASGSVVAAFLEMHLVPTAALLLQVLLLASTLITMRMALVCLRIITGRAMVEVLGAVSIGTWVVLSAAGLIPTNSAANASYLLNLGSWHLAPERGMTAAVILLAVLILSYVLLFMLDRKAVGEPLRWGVTTIVYVVLTSIVIVLSMAQALQHSGDFWDALQYSFYGTAGTTTQYLMTMFVFAGYAFTFQLRQSANNRGLNSLQLIRFGSFRTWAARLLSFELLKLAGLLVYVAFLCIFAFFVLGGRSFSSPLDTGAQAYHFAVNGVMQLVFYVSVAFVASCFTSFPLAGTVTVAGIVVLGATPLGSLLGSPIGASSMSWAAMGWPAVLQSTLGLVSGTAVAVAALTAIGRARRPFLLKGADR
jgi:hypothetical protein